MACVEVDRKNENRSVGVLRPYVPKTRPARREEQVVILFPFYREFAQLVIRLACFAVDLRSQCVKKLVERPGKSFSVFKEPSGSLLD